MHSMDSTTTTTVLPADNNSIPTKEDDTTTMMMMIDLCSTSTDNNTVPPSSPMGNTSIGDSDNTSTSAVVMVVESRSSSQKDNISSSPSSPSIPVQPQRHSYVDYVEQYCKETNDYHRIYTKRNDFHNNSNNDNSIDTDELPVVEVRKIRRKQRLRNDYNDDKNVSDPWLQQFDPSFLDRNRILLHSTTTQQQRRRTTKTGLSSSSSSSSYDSVVLQQQQLSQSTSEVRIGTQFQAYVPTKPLYPIWNTKQHPSQQQQQQRENHYYTPIWDSTTAAQNVKTASSSLQSDKDEIDQFISQSHDLTIKNLLMEALHTASYNVQDATEIFVNLYNQQSSSKIDYGDMNDFADAFATDLFTKTKDFDYIAKKLNCTKEIVLIQYYRWKKSKLYTNRPMSYQRMKDDRHHVESSDECDICHNGGNLIVCDLCNRAYHTDCLVPPLLSIPHEQWFCTHCETPQSPTKIRRLSGYHKILYSPQQQQHNSNNNNARRDRTSLSHPTEDDNAIDTDIPQQIVPPPDKLKCIHKELFSGLMKPTNTRPEITRTYSYESTKVKPITYSPKKMIWNSQLGYYVEKHSTPTRYIERNPRTVVTNGSRNNNSNNQPNMATVTTISHGLLPPLPPLPTVGNHIQNPNANNNNGHIHKYPTVPNGGHHQPLLQHSTNTSLSTTVNSNGMSNNLAVVPNECAGELYTVQIPITSDKLYIFIEKRQNNGYTSFSGYCPTSMGGIGYAQRNNLFRAAGDFILAVDQLPCYGKSFAEVKAILKTPPPGATVRVLKMFHPLNPNK